MKESLIVLDGKSHRKECKGNNVVNKLNYDKECLDSITAKEEEEEEDNAEDLAKCNDNDINDNDSC